MPGDDLAHSGITIRSTCQLIEASGEQHVERTFLRSCDGNALISPSSIRDESLEIQITALDLFFCHSLTDVVKVRFLDRCHSCPDLLEPRDETLGQCVVSKRLLHRKANRVSDGFQSFVRLVSFDEFTEPCTGKVVRVPSFNIPLPFGQGLVEVRNQPEQVAAVLGGPLFLAGHRIHRRLEQFQFEHDEDSCPVHFFTLAPE